MIAITLHSSLEKHDSMSHRRWTLINNETYCKLPFLKLEGRRGRDPMVVELSVQSVPITTKVVSSHPAHSEVYSIQHCDKVCQ